MPVAHTVGLFLLIFFTLRRTSINHSSSRATFRLKHYS